MTEDGARQKETVAVDTPTVFSRIKSRWYTNEEVANILKKFPSHPEWQTNELQLRPKSGAVLLYSREKIRYRQDGYCWKKRKNGRTTREDHMKLKVQGVECIYGCYVHSAILPTFHRRCYWLLENPDIVLVHYLNQPLDNDQEGKMMITLDTDLLEEATHRRWTNEEIIEEIGSVFGGVSQIKQMLNLNSPFSILDPSQIANQNQFQQSQSQLQQQQQQQQQQHQDQQCPTIQQQVQMPQLVGQFENICHLDKLVVQSDQSRLLQEQICNDLNDQNKQQHQQQHHQQSNNSSPIDMLTCQPGTNSDHSSIVCAMDLANYDLSEASSASLMIDHLRSPSPQQISQSRNPQTPESLLNRSHQSRQLISNFHHQQQQQQHQHQQHHHHHHHHHHSHQLQVNSLSLDNASLNLNEDKSMNSDDCNNNNNNNNNNNSSSNHNHLSNIGNNDRNNIPNQNNDSNSNSGNANTLLVPIDIDRPDCDEVDCDVLNQLSAIDGEDLLIGGQQDQSDHHNDASSMDLFSYKLNNCHSSVLTETKSSVSDTDFAILGMTRLDTLGSCSAPRCHSTGGDQTASLLSTMSYNHSISQYLSSDLELVGQGNLLSVGDSFMQRSSVGNLNPNGGGGGGGTAGGSSQTATNMVTSCSSSCSPAMLSSLSLQTVGMANATGNSSGVETCSPSCSSDISGISSLRPGCDIIKSNTRNLKQNNNNNNRKQQQDQTDFSSNGMNETTTATNQSGTFSLIPNGSLSKALSLDGGNLSSTSEHLNDTDHARAIKSSTPQFDFDSNRNSNSYFFLHNNSNNNNNSNSNNDSSDKKTNNNHVNINKDDTSNNRNVVTSLFDQIPRRHQSIAGPPFESFPEFIIANRGCSTKRASTESSSQIILGSMDSPGPVNNSSSNNNNNSSSNNNNSNNNINNNNIGTNENLLIVGRTNCTRINSTQEFSVNQDHLIDHFNQSMSNDCGGHSKKHQRRSLSSDVNMDISNGCNELRASNLLLISNVDIGLSNIKQQMIDKRSSSLGENSKLLPILDYSPNFSNVSGGVKVLIIGNWVSLLSSKVAEMDIDYRFENDTKIDIKKFNSSSSSNNNNNNNNNNSGSSSGSSVVIMNENSERDFSCIRNLIQDEPTAGANSIRQMENDEAAAAATAATVSGILDNENDNCYASKAQFSVMFDNTLVPASLIQDNVLKCYAPSHRQGFITLEVLHKDKIVSEQVLFEMRQLMPCPT